MHDSTNIYCADGAMAYASVTTGYVALPDKWRGKLTFDLTILQWINKCVVCFLCVSNHFIYPGKFTLSYKASSHGLPEFVFWDYAHFSLHTTRRCLDHQGDNKTYKNIYRHSAKTQLLILISGGGGLWDTILGHPKQKPGSRHTHKEATQYF